MRIQNHFKKLFSGLIAIVLLQWSSSYAFNGRSMSLLGKKISMVWTWMGGSSVNNETPVYGNLGSPDPVPPVPGSRFGACSWTDSTGMQWFFGGQASLGTNYYNDLWKYNPTTGEWIWVAGPNVPNVGANYGIQGVSSANNLPGSRYYCSTWVDASDNLWLFGGFAGSNYYNDMWKYNQTTGQWTWITGANTANQNGTYGTQGVDAAANTPGARGRTITWKDNSGNFWLFSGSYSVFSYNDIWKFNPTNNRWTWVSGQSSFGPYVGVYGTQGSSALVPPFPGSRALAATCTDATGNQWMYGGQIYTSSSYTYADLWKHNPAANEWTWMGGAKALGGSASYGSKGVAAAGNTPGARSSSACWVDASGNFWLFGGYTPTTSKLGDLWKYNPTTNQWTWMAGANSINTYGVYGTKGVGDSANTPGARVNSMSWLGASGDLWLFGGEGYAASPNSGTLNDLWKYDMSLNQWVWISGSDKGNLSGVYGTVSSSATVAPHPSSRYGSVSWKDSSGNQWLFGGYNTGGLWNDLWKYDPVTNAWTWISGSDKGNLNGVYGTRGSASVSNIPGARYNSTSWIDNSGNLWLSGGNGYAASGGIGFLNDLWKYNPATNEWTWVSGVNFTNGTATYGTRGVSAVSNIPAARQDSASWVDNSGNLWLFGGVLAGGTNRINDLWKYDPSLDLWTWMNGGNSANNFGAYGVKGTAGVSNTPGARSDATIWTDSSGNFWLFGGAGYGISGGSGALNDLWKYNPATNEWTWVSGANSTNNVGTYGTKGTPAVSNIPGARYGSAVSVDTSGNFWLFGGAGYGVSGGLGVLNDLWKYNSSTNEWIWVSGASSTNNVGVCGTKGSPAVSNTPGARSYHNTWTDSSGNFWLFGGSGYGISAGSGALNDLWKYDSSTNEWTWIEGEDYVSAASVYGTKGSSAGVLPDPGGRIAAASWIDASGDLWLFGGYGYGGILIGGFLNDLWKYEVNSDKWIWVSGVPSSNRNGVYGTKGAASVSNIPGARQHVLGKWVDSSGNLWLFGGNGYAASGGSGYLNDLWKYDVASNQWTWMNGASTSNSLGTYGTKGTFGVSNTPGARYMYSGWPDASGNFWLYGGYGYAASGGLGYLNDVWKYDVASNQWAWISGANVINMTGVYGTRGSTSGTAPYPGTRYGGLGWKDTSGNVWIFGGYGAGESQFSSASYLNDLWKYNPATNEWSWMSGSFSTLASGFYGVKGTPAVSNVPGARAESVSWTDTSGNLWLFGGNNGSRLNDLWRYNSNTNEWTWMSGANTTNSSAVYGTQGVASTSNVPGSRYSSTAWTGLAGSFWLFGGYDGTGTYNDLWKYNTGTNEWTWVAGSNMVNSYSVYGVKGSSAAVYPYPSARVNSATWQDASGNFWLFGGNSTDGYLNDLWKLNPVTNRWTWVGGTKTLAATGVYGTKGIASSTTLPGARMGSTTWQDASGNFWLFGGSDNSVYPLSDLWKYNPNTNQWTWMSGPNMANQLGIYGTKGTPSVSNIPGSRQLASGWQDASGNFWLFGGTGYGISGGSGALNDLWKYNSSTNEWTWVSGASSTNNVGVYGTKGTPAVSNIPGARYGSAVSVDTSGNFWLFGGYGYVAAANGFLNDLWKYNSSTNEWTWVSGANSTNNVGVYGTKGTPAVSNTPGSRLAASGWQDASGNFWLFGGHGYETSGISGYLNDLWKYDITTDRWTWMMGSVWTTAFGAYGTYGTKGVPSPTNIPGTRGYYAKWMDANGNMWFYGGWGNSTSTVGNLNDLWYLKMR